MKKRIGFGMAVVLATGAVFAQEDVVIVSQGDSDAPKLEASIEAVLASANVWRGQVRNNDFVFQPQATLAMYGVSLNVWANYDIGRNYDGVEGDVSEMNFSLAYTLPIDISEVSFDLGLVNYQYPGNNANNESTTELFAKATVQSWKEYVIPSVTVFGDIDEADGIYVLFDLVAPYQISDYLWIEGGVSAGWGDSSYNDYYWGGNQDKGFNDYNFYATAKYEIIENLNATLNLTYTALDGGSLRDAGKTIYEAGEKFYGGAGIVYDF